MGILDIDSLLQDVSPDLICGPNLEYDPEFLALEQAILGKPEIQYGTTVTPAVPPEWKEIKQLSSALLGRSRDLRLAVPLLRALLAQHGVAGFAAGAVLIDGMLTRMWDSVHPQLDPDDELDPVLRINSLATLVDPSTTIKELKEAPFIVLPGLGALSLRHLEIASGELQISDGSEKIALASIEAALRDVEFEKLAGALADMQQAHDAVVNIEVFLVRQVGSSQALNMDGLIRLLKRGRDLLSNSFQERSEAEGEPELADGGAVVETGGARNAGSRAANSDEIASRDDVIRMIDKICKYYRQFEPSSPIPIFLLRAKKLVPKNFYEIMQDLAPDGLSQLAVISGQQGSSEEE
jgi:type VI secretion system protein ImpA